MPADLEIALQHHRAGDLHAAEAIYRQILAREPNCAEALHLLGVVRQAKGELPTALDLVQQAVRLNPQNALFHASLAELALLMDDPDASADHAQRSIDLNPTAGHFHFTL